MSDNTFPSDTPTTIELAIRKLGRRKKVAEVLGVSCMAVAKWERQNSIPTSRLADFCALTKMHPRNFNSDVKKLYERWH